MRHSKGIFCFLIFVACLGSSMCVTAPAQGPRLSFRILPSSITVNLADAFFVTLELENNSDTKYWVGTGIGYPDTRGIPYTSFFAKIRRHGEETFWPTTLTYVHLPSE